jgi:lantibiotic biosynthesis protein
MVQVVTEFVPSGFFVLRTPLLPFNELLKWSDSAGTTRQDRSRARRFLSELLVRAEIQEALFVASPDLVNALDEWRQDPDSKRGRRVETSLVRYFLRMAGRPTPFGLFAGYSVGRVDSNTQLLIEGRSTYGRHTRLDMEYVCALVATLEQDEQLRQKFIHRPNSSLYRAAGRVRYVEAHTDEKARVYRLVAIDSDPLLDAALSLARDGIYPLQLAAALADNETNLSLAEAEDFVNELIESQILISDLGPAITGDEPAASLLSKLALHDEAAELTSCLQRCVRRLRELDENGLGNAVADYGAVIDGLASLSPRFDRRRLLQIDLKKPASQATLGKDVIAEITRGVEILRQSFDARRRDLSSFRDVFLERYGAGREVPLLEALDPDVGIAFALSNTTSADAFESRSWTNRDSYLLRLMQRAMLDASDQITLDQNDLDALRARAPLQLPDAFAVTASIAAASEAELARGRFRVGIRNVQGPSGVRLLGRFCHFDDALSQKTKQHILAEESLRPDALFAEIVHLPAGRTGNVLLRPRLRDYEIPYLDASGNPVSQQIPVTDLSVTVIHDRVVLRSMSLRREVIPRLTAAHYYFIGGLDVYRFLCLMQDQDYASELEWDWGLTVYSPFLPRICYQRLVLSRARWNLNANDLQKLRKVSRAEMVSVIQEWRAERKWPRWIAVVDDDNELPIDLDNVLCNDTLVELIKGREAAQLVEVFPAPEDLCVRGPEGQFAHEIIVPFVRAQPTVQAVRGAIVADTPPAKRTFVPGSEWLYLKLYTGKSTADQLLRELVHPLISNALASGSCTQWFFIRYGDPFWHIRLRFRGSPNELQTTLLPLVNAAIDPFVSAGKIWRVQIDTYEREVERYGGAEGIILAEKIFHADSEAVITIIAGRSGNEGLDARRLLALRGIDRLFDDFGVELRDRLGLTETLREKFTGRLASDRRSDDRFATVYRNMRANIERIIGGTDEMKAVFVREFAALDRRSQDMEPTIAKLKTYAGEGQLSVSLPELISHFIHMHLNRMLRPSQRTEELLVYHLLVRYYRSQTARGEN